MYLSKILEMMGSMLIGRKFSLFRGSFFLINKGTTCACFSPKGSFFSYLYFVLMRSDIALLTDGAHAFRMFAEILSTPVEFLISKFEITFSTYISLVGLKENLFSGSFCGAIFQNLFKTRVI